VLAPGAAPRLAYPTSRFGPPAGPSTFDMAVLRRALQAFAAIWAGCGVALIVVPGWLLTDVFDQPRYPDYTYVRVAGALSMTLAALAVMVSRRDDAWWWAWAFAIATGLTATITLLHVLLDVPDGEGTALWWLFATVSAGLTIWLVVGLTRASQDHPIG
jgi:hypothetical protein